MRKIKITQEQYRRLVNEVQIKDRDPNFVDTRFVKAFKNADVQKLKPVKLSEEPSGKKFNPKDPNENIPGSRMKKTPELDLPIKLKEDIFSPEFHQAIHNFIQNIWMNPSQKGLDRVFVQNGITWGDITSYLTSIGVLAAAGAGMYKVKNFFKTRFSPDQKEAMAQKMEDIEKITKMVEKDPEAPWNNNPDEETTYQRKQRMQAKPESGFKAEPKPFNPNRFKPGLEETEDDEYTYDKDYYNDKETQYTSKAPKVFKGIGMGRELAILSGPDGNYIFDYSNFGRDDLPNANYELELEDIVDFVNDNYKDNSVIRMGSGLQSFETGDDLVKLDDELKAELSALYGKDVKFISLLNKLDEYTVAANAGPTVGPIGGAPANRNITRGYTPAKEINRIINNEDEMYGAPIKEDTATIGVAADGSPTTPSGPYTGAKFLAKDEANFAASKRTQYPNGEMVKFDPCTRLNNNKKAQNGGCSQGAADSVVKTHKTKDSVISKNIYETIAKKTGKTVAEVKKIIESRKGKSL
jgi:hypothetical protein